MSIHFAPLKVKEIIRETPDANTVVFEKPGDGSYDYKPGQYLTLKLFVNGEEVRRAYSLCSAPGIDDGLAVTVKRVDGGRASNWVADQMKAGDTVEVLPPMGKFTVDIDASKAHHYVLFGGGSGITPLMSILKSVLLREPNSKVTLLFGNRDEQSIIFNTTLKEFSAKYPERFRVMHFLESHGSDWTGQTGRLDRHNVLSHAQSILDSDHLPKSFWMCGPGPMMEETLAALGFLGIPKDQVHKESFTAPLPSTDKPATTVTSEGQRGTYTITVKLDGKESQVEVDENTTILEAVIDDGQDPPYACQMGVCCTCRAKILSGKVEMEEDEGLSDTEIEQGYILTCQSHPLTSDVVIEYQ